ncbi:hypothetical protein GTO10_03085 [Candidatus Saccharibacteria bacterium]|nr:hypothetical protein [Candidatus Saccharibacteria bacterium]
MSEEVDAARRNIELALRLTIFKKLMEGPKTSCEVGRIFNLSEVDCSSALRSLESVEAVRFVCDRWEVTEKGKRLFERF